jgi:hypothetical protein
MVRKPFPEDTRPEFLKALEERQKESQALGDALVNNLKLERALREHNQEEFKKAKRRALLTLARTDPIAAKHRENVMAKAHRIVGYGYKRERNK